MSIKKAKELANLTVDELSSKVRETEAELFKLRMQLKTGQISDTASVWRNRKQLARLKSHMTQKAGGGSKRPGGKTLH